MMRMASAAASPPPAAAAEPAEQRVAAAGRRLGQRPRARGGGRAGGLLRLREQPAAARAAEPGADQPAGAEADRAAAEATAAKPARAAEAAGAEPPPPRPPAPAVSARWPRPGAMPAGRGRLGGDVLGRERLLQHVGHVVAAAVLQVEGVPGPDGAAPGVFDQREDAARAVDQARLRGRHQHRVHALHGTTRICAASAPPCCARSASCRAVAMSRASPEATGSSA